MSRRVANLGRGPAACSALQLASATMTTRERSDITLKGLVQRVTPPPPPWVASHTEVLSLFGHSFLLI